MKNVISKKRPRKVSCRAAVRRMLAERDVSAETMLVALLDVVIDSHADRELRQRGLGPAVWPEGLTHVPEDALTTAQRAVYDSEFQFGKGFGRQPARGSVADVAEEQVMRFQPGFDEKLSPTQLALRHLMYVGWTASFRFLDKVDPQAEREEEAPIERESM